MATSNAVWFAARGACFAGIMAFGASCLASDDLDEAEDVGVQRSELWAPSGLYVTSDARPGPWAGSHCATLRVNFTPARGGAISYELQRRVGWTGRPATVAYTDGTSRSVTDSHAPPRVGTTYHYRIRSLGLFGMKSGWSRWARYDVRSNPCKAHKATRGTTHEVRVFLAAASDLHAELEAELPPSRVAELLFSEDNSAAAFLDEQSAGARHTRYAPHVRLAGSIHGNRWHRLRHRRAHYRCTEDCRSMGDMAPMRDELVAAGIAARDVPVEPGSFETLEPGVLYLYIFAFEGNGAATGGPRIVMGHRSLMEADDKSRQAPYHIAAHELGHALGMRHAGLLDCGGFPPSPLPAGLHGYCSGETYGSDATIMSTGTGPAFAYTRWKTGMLPGRAVWIDASDDPDPTMAPLGSGEAVEVDLYDAVGMHGSSANQMAFVKVEADGSAYVLEYRRAIGFNSETWFGRWWQPTVEGVHTTFRPGRNLDVGDSEVFELAGAAPLGPGSSRVDPARGLRFRVVEDRGYRVRVRIERY